MHCIMCLQVIGEAILVRNTLSYDMGVCRLHPDFLLQYSNGVEGSMLAPIMHKLPVKSMLSCRLIQDI